MVSVAEDSDGPGEGDADGADEPVDESDSFADAFGGGSDDERDETDEADEESDEEAFDFGGGSDDEEDFGFGGGAGEEDFGFGGGAGEEAFGFAGGGEDDSFEEDEFESEIPRVELGIDGLDNMIQGGLPERSLAVTIGSAGTGKTTFGLQFLHEGISSGERGVFISLEESRERVVRSAEEKGMPFEQYVADGDLAIVDIDPVEMANSLASIRDELPRLIEEFGASRLVLDSVSLLEMMYDDQATRRTDIYDFTRSLKQAGVTTLLTSEASEDNPYASRHGIIEYLTDAVIILRYIRTEDFRETRLAVEIQKIRDANHSRETKPYEITGEGISVYRQANIF